MNRNLFVKVIFGIVLAVLVVSFLNVGISLFYERPEYNDFCEEPFPCITTPKEVTEEENQKARECYDQFNEATKKHDRFVFFILAPIGLILLIVGTRMNKNLTLQIMSMGAGFASVVSGIVRNIQDKLSVFITIGILIIIGILFTLKKLKD